MSDEPRVVKVTDFDDSGNQRPDDDFTGVWEVYWANGNLKIRCSYVKGVEEGDFLCYHENGIIAQRGIMVKGHCSGLWTDFNTDGRKILEGMFGPKGKYGVWKSFWSNGLVMSEEEHVDGEQHGFSRTFDFNGNLEFEGEYRNDNPYNGICEVLTFNHEEDYGYHAMFKDGVEISRLSKGFLFRKKILIKIKRLWNLVLQALRGKF